MVVGHSALETLSSEVFLAVLVYWLGLSAMLMTSGFYHMTPWEQWRDTLRKLDHAVIFFKIAATFTPFVVVIGSLLSYVILAALWVLAIIGAVRKLFIWQNPKPWIGSLFYLAMGWMGVFLMWSIFDISTLAGCLSVTGGLLYTAGVLFFNWESLKFSLAIWHFFVLAASACYFVAIYLVTTAV
jgi:hemolysin III